MPHQLHILKLSLHYENFLLLSRVVKPFLVEVQTVQTLIRLLNQSSLIRAYSVCKNTYVPVYKVILVNGFVHNKQKKSKVLIWKIRDNILDLFV